MPAKKYRVRLSEEERQELKGLVSRGRAAAYRQTHARILLLSDEVQGSGAMRDGDIARSFQIGSAKVERVRRRCVEEGVEAALGRREQLNRRQRKLGWFRGGSPDCLGLWRASGGPGRLDAESSGGPAGGQRDSGEQSYARVRAGQRRLTGERTQECILHGKACRLERDR